MSAGVASLALWQAAAVALDMWACNGTAGRRKDAPVYVQVTQGRDGPGPEQWRRYSSCADRAHWRLWRLGCRLPFVNRTDRATGRAWKPGVNISNLWNRGLGAPVLRRPGGSWQPQPGDELLIWNTGNDAHSCSVVEPPGPGSETALTANYGAAGMAPTPIGGCRAAPVSLYFDGRDWRCGHPGRTRIVQAVLTLEALVPLFTEAPDLSGPDWSDTYTGEVADALGARLSGPM